MQDSEQEASWHRRIASPICMASALQNRGVGDLEVEMPPNTAVYHRAAEATGQVTNGIGDLERVRRLS